MAKRHISKILDEKAARGEVRIYTLTCITDGGTIDFVDEGPFAVMDGKPVDGWKQRDPSGRRQHLIKQLRKRTIVEVDGEEGEYQVWVHAFRGPGGEILPLVLNADSKAGPVGPCVRTDKTLTKAALPLPVWMMEFAVDFPIPLADDKWIAAHRVLLQNRNHAADRGRRELNRAVKVEEEKRVKAPAMPAHE